jgi:hypothetical protein
MEGLARRNFLQIAEISGERGVGADACLTFESRSERLWQDTPTTKGVRVCNSTHPAGVFTTPHIYPSALQGAWGRSNKGGLVW